MSRSLFSSLKIHQGQSKESKNRYEEDDDGGIYLSKLASGTLIRPLGNIENFFYVAGKYGSCFCVETIWINSESPIQPSYFRNAASKVATCFPHLQICVANRKGKKWFKKVDEIVVDFEETTETLDNVVHHLACTPFDMKHDLLWRVRLVIMSSHSAVLVLCTQHCITDGITHMTILKEMVNFVNAELKGGLYYLEEKPLSPNLIAPLTNGRSKFHEMSIIIKSFINTFIKDFRSANTWNKIYSSPNKENSCLNPLSHIEILPTEVTLNIVKKCKINKVTINSFILASINISLYLTLKSLDKSIQHACIKSSSAVDMRRYFKKEHKNTLGLHTSALLEKTHVDDNDVKDFWRFAQRMQSEIYDHLNKNPTPITTAHVIAKGSLIHPINDYLFRRARKTRMYHHYFASNMGDLSVLLKANPGPISIYRCTRYLPSHTAPYCCLFLFHTFNNEMVIQNSYFPDRINTSFIKSAFHRLIAWIIEVSND